MTDHSESEEYIDLPPPRRVPLEKIRLAIRASLTDLMLDLMLEEISGLGVMEAKLEEWREAFRHVTVYEISGFIWGQKHKAVRFTTPASWWDHVKERFFPAWLLARFPLRYREEIVEALLLLPSLDLRIPGHTTEIVLQTIPATAVRSRKVLPWRTQLRSAE